MLTKARCPIQPRDRTGEVGGSRTQQVHYPRADDFRARTGGKLVRFHRVIAVCGAFTLAGCADTIHNEAARGDLDALRARLASDRNACDALNREGKTALHYAINFAQRDAFILLVESGQCDINAQDRTGMTPLHCAASIGLPAAIPMLVEAGADLEARDAFGDTPLHTAAMKGHTEMVRALLEAGADYNAVNDDNRTARDLARRYNQPEAAALLERTP